MSVGSMMQQAGTNKRCKSPTHLFLTGISAIKDIPQQVCMDVMILLSGQCSVLELQSAVVYPCTYRRGKPLADSKTIGWFQSSENVFATKWCTEESGCSTCDADKPVAAPRHRKHDSVKIDRTKRLKQFHGFVPDSVLYSVFLYGLYTSMQLQ